MPKPTAVLLVDHKQRDLLGCALIARHLETMGVRTHLEPINAWQAVLGAHKPDFVLFNHTARAHLADYTQRLSKMGVLTGVLLNEGLLFNEQVRIFNSQRLSNLHLDYYFCWNDLHRECLLANGHKDKTEVVTVGVPRFDFYFEPWKNVFKPSPRKLKNRPRILLCTNFGYAEWRGRAKETVDRFFSQWNHMPGYADYRNAIEVSHRSRLRFLNFVEAILNSGKFEVILKTHPRETRRVYEKWMANLSPELQKDLTYVPSDANITPLILDCDLEISCEKCTTSMESWIARKPTIELIFERHPLFFDENLSSLNATCDSPEKLVGQIEAQLREPEQLQFASGRKNHLAKWCHTPDGNVAKKIAKKIATALSNPPRKKELALGFHDFRRAAKLKLYRAVNEPYSYQPFLKLKNSLFSGKRAFSKQLMLYEKAVTPHEVKQTLARIKSCQKASEKR